MYWPKPSTPLGMKPLSEFPRAEPPKTPLSLSLSQLSGWDIDFGRWGFYFIS